MPYKPRDHELEFSAIRAQGPGGQHVNKASTAVQLRFHIPSSGLPEAVKARLLAMADRRITQEGDVLIKSQGARSQELNKLDAVQRLHALIARAEFVPKVRRATKPTLGSQRRRLEGKALRSQIKASRGKPSSD